MDFTGKRQYPAALDLGQFYYVAKFIVALAASFWLSVPVMVQLLVGAMALDFFTGLLIATFIERNLDSHKSYVGLARKALTLVIVTTGAIIPKVLKVDIPLGSWIAAAYIINEMISITENCARAGVPIPPALLDVLAKAKNMTGRGTSANAVISRLETTSASVTDAVDGTHTEIKSSSSETVSKP